MLCDDSDGCDAGGGDSAMREGIYVYEQLSHFVV